MALDYGTRLRNGLLWRKAGRVLPVNDDPVYLRVELNIANGEGDEAYMSAPFFLDSHEEFTMYDIVTVNERFAACVSLLTNTIVILVFLRVLCLKRLTSQLLVSLAVSNIVATLTHAVHSFTVGSFMATESILACKFTYSLAMNSWILIWTNLSLAVTERLVAINMPMYYTATHTLIACTCNVSPWFYYGLLVLLDVLGIFDYEFDYGCSNHLMYTPLEPAKMVIQLLTYSILIVMIVILIMSRVLHPVFADDALEVNRIKLEMKTTYVVLKVSVVHVLLFFPLMLASSIFYYNDARAMFELKLNLLFYQFAIHGNSILFFVMLRRKEFRKAVSLIFASSSSIRKARPMNLLLEVTEARRKKSTDVDADPASGPWLAKLTAREDLKKYSTASPLPKQ